MLIDDQRATTIAEIIQETPKPSAEYLITVVERLLADRAEQSAEIAKLEAERDDLERTRQGLAKICEVNEAFHWRLVDLFDPTMRGVSPLHYVEEQIKNLMAKLRATEPK